MTAMEITSEKVVHTGQMFKNCLNLWVKKLQMFL